MRNYGFKRLAELMESLRDRFKVERRSDGPCTCPATLETKRAAVFRRPFGLALAFQAVGALD